MEPIRQHALSKGELNGEITIRLNEERQKQFMKDKALKDDLMDYEEVLPHDFLQNWSICGNQIRKKNGKAADAQAIIVESKADPLQDQVEIQ